MLARISSACPVKIGYSLAGNPSASARKCANALSGDSSVTAAFRAAAMIAAGPPSAPVPFAFVARAASFWLAFLACFFLSLAPVLFLSLPTGTRVGD